MIDSPVQETYFDEAAISAMGAAFDQACLSLGRFACTSKGREIVAKRIIEAATRGELDPLRLYSQAIKDFSIGDVSMPVVSVGRTTPRVLPMLLSRA